MSLIASIDVGTLLGCQIGLTLVYAIAFCCMKIIYPYLRETISDMISRGGFPPVILAPLNFEALYLQQQQNAAPTQPGPRYEVARN